MNTKNVKTKDTLDLAVLAEDSKAKKPLINSKSFLFSTTSNM
jgi:hypothetical protein